MAKQKDNKISDKTSQVLQYKAGDVFAMLDKKAKPEKVKILSSFFKTGKGQYGEGDKFIGVNVPDQRAVAKEVNSRISLVEVEKIIKSKTHEHRLTGLVILNYKYNRVGKIKDAKERQRRQKEIYDFYMGHLEAVNNWDLVDCTSRGIIGAYIYDYKHKDAYKILSKMLKDKNLWVRRIAIVVTSYFISKEELDLTFKITEDLLGDKHDLMHKACGWMLREAGKKSEHSLHKFLKQHVKQMPRTMLRYSIERLSEEFRRFYLKA